MKERVKVVLWCLKPSFQQKARSKRERQLDTSQLLPPLIPQQRLSQQVYGLSCQFHKLFNNSVTVNRNLFATRKKNYGCQVIALIIYFIFIAFSNKLQVCKQLGQPVECPEPECAAPSIYRQIVPITRRLHSWEATCLQTITVQL